MMPSLPCPKARAAVLSLFPPLTHAILTETVSPPFAYTNCVLLGSAACCSPTVLAPSFPVFSACGWWARGEN